jgi:hypothetical protein
MDDEGYFPIRRPTDEEGYVAVVEKDARRFLFGREGDQYITTFQCDLCHFRNMNDRSPQGNGDDDMLLRFIRRANLDALWSREPGTVRNTWRELKNLASADAVSDLTFGTITWIQKICERFPWREEGPPPIYISFKGEIWISETSV